MKAKERIEQQKSRADSWEKAYYGREEVISAMRDKLRKAEEKIADLKREVAWHQPKTEWRITNCAGIDVTVFAHKYEVPASFYNNDGTVVAKFKDATSVINVTQEKENGTK